MSEQIATLMPLENWIKLFNLTKDSITESLHRGEILGVTVERDWVRSSASPSLAKRAAPGSGGNAFQIIHPEFQLTILAADLGEISRLKDRNHYDVHVPILMTGDFDAYDRFQVLLKMIDD